MLRTEKQSIKIFTTKAERHTSILAVPTILEYNIMCGLSALIFDVI